MVGTATGQLTQTHSGVTHLHQTAGKRSYYMHYIALTGLAAKAKYFYKVRSGAPGAETSDEFSFRAPYGSGETRIALYGDMGV